MSVKFDAEPNQIGMRLDPEMLASYTEYMFNTTPVCNEHLGLTPKVVEVESAEIFYRMMNKRNGRIDMAELSSTDGSHLRLSA